MLILLPAVEGFEQPSYGRAAAIMSLDANFLIFRKFEFLRIHVLLDMQGRLRLLEGSLENYYKMETKKRRLTSCKIGYDHPESRKGIIEKIDKMLERYGERIDAGLAFSLTWLSC